MITTDFTGNFGNHIFQYVLLRSVAERKNFEWGFTNNIYRDYFGGKPQLDFFDLDYGQPVEGIEQEYQEKYITLNGHTNIYFYDTFKDLQDNSKLVGFWQTEKYFDKEKVRKWLKYKPEIEEKFQDIDIPENLCIINVRGGEYKLLPEVLLPLSYWNGAINHMLRVNKSIQFAVITDDVPYASSLFPQFKCYHYSIAMDYYIINKVRYLILSNSSFPWFAAWLNENAKFIIAPKYWARYNISDGFWANGNIFTKGWMYYYHKTNKLQTYDEIVKELKESRYSNLYIL